MTSSTFSVSATRRAREKQAKITSGGSQTVEITRFIGSIVPSDCHVSGLALTVCRLESHGTATRERGRYDLPTPPWANRPILNWHAKNLVIAVRSGAWLPLKRSSMVCTSSEYERLVRPTNSFSIASVQVTGRVTARKWLDRNCSQLNGRLHLSPLYLHMTFHQMRYSRMVSLSWSMKARVTISLVQVSSYHC